MKASEKTRLLDENGDYRTCERLGCDGKAAAGMAFFGGLEHRVVCGGCRIQTPPIREFPPVEHLLPEDL